MKRSEIGVRFCTLRILRRLAQGEMGAAAHLSKSTVHKIEKGDRELSFYEAVAFAQVLCISLDAVYRTGANGIWDITACLLPYSAPLAGPLVGDGDPLLGTNAPLA
mgnify:FL=1